MDPNQNNQQPQQPVAQELPVPQMPAQAPVPATSAPVPETPQTTPAQPVTEAVPAQAPTPPLEKKPALGMMAKFNSLPKSTKLLVGVVGGAMALILILLVAGIIYKSMGGMTANVVQTPTPVASPVGSSAPVVITNPSKYATDSAVLAIEAEVDNLTRDMSTVDLRESDLRVPTLDFNIKF